MQRLSSKNNELLMHVSELFDGQCHQKLEGDEALLVSDEAKQHFKRWALIGSGLRRELHGKVDLNFSEKVMSKISASNAELTPLTKEADQSSDFEKLPSALRMWKPVTPQTQSHAELASANEATKEQDFVALDSTLDQPCTEVCAKADNVKLELPRRVKFFKRVGIVATQVGIAAGVAAVAVIGMQTYNAAEVTTPNIATNTAFNSGPVSGLNLASYQTSNQDLVMRMDGNSDLTNSDEAESPIVQGRETAQFSQSQDVERVNSYLQGFVQDGGANSSLGK